MPDPAVVEECARCLVGACLYDGADADVALTATALARDLADTKGAQAPALLDAAARGAAAHLNASDLGADAFAAALRRLSRIQARVDAALLDGSPAGGRLAV
ncbi:MAG TPA: hypothetical protein VME22_15410 [Solirubrobacteraceae bacterium]|nr:hypothetical protein [Solirubrobacteraceae bacterium]